VTTADVFIRVLSEATGKPPAEVKDLVDRIFRVPGTSGALYEELPDDLARRLLAALLRQLPAIRDHLEGAGRLVRDESGDADERKS